jgi:hypothetical protein
MRPLYIAIPAWSADYVRTAVKFVVPSLVASLAAAGRSAADVRFQVWTDDRASFDAVLGDWPVDYRDVALPGYRAVGGVIMPEPQRAPSPPRNRTELLAQLRAQQEREKSGRAGAPIAGPRRDPLPREFWAAFMQAHRDAIALTPQGAICCLFNADIVCSIETFAEIGRLLGDGAKKVAISVGIRTLLDGNECPVGVDAETLSRWIWSHRHPITDDAIWGSGTTRHPTILFFEHGDGAVSMHCFHQTPMFVVKDRTLAFKGTIDDDLLQHYRDDELIYLSDRGCCFAELSYAWKRHPSSGTPMTVETVTDFGKRRFRPSHIRNFRYRFRVLGNPSANHPAVDQILAALS